MSQATPSQIVLALALVFGIATGVQVVAPRLRLPALVLLLPAGFLLGVIAPELRITGILGPAFPVVVDLMVAVILFQGGMELTAIPLRASDRSVVRRLVWMGGAITLLSAALAGHVLIGLDWPVAFMLGAILVVSGPTVVTPILDFARPSARLRGILMWEGTLLDPLGALVAVGVFQILMASDATSPVQAVGMFLVSLVTAVLAAMVGVLLFVVGGHLAKGSTMLGTQVLLGSVLLSAGLANAVTPDSGLLTALLLGISAPRIASRFGASLADARPFFNTIVSIGIGVLFISIASLVPYDSIVDVLVPVLGVAVVLIVIVRPVVALISTPRSGLSIREKSFIAAMDPRGIVAAATASSVGAALVAKGVAGADVLLPAAFIIIFVTVVFYSLSATPLASALGVRGDPSGGDA